MLALEAHCPTCFPSFPTLTHLDQISPGLSLLNTQLKHVTQCTHCGGLKGTQHWNCTGLLAFVKSVFSPTKEVMCYSCSCLSDSGVTFCSLTIMPSLFCTLEGPLEGISICCTFSLEGHPYWTSSSPHGSAYKGQYFLLMEILYRALSHFFPLKGNL